MKIRYDPYELQLRHTFTISRSSSDTKRVVIVEIEKDGISGYGEASPSSRYGETAETVINFLKRIETEKLYDPFLTERNSNYLESLSDDDSSARAAIDIALHDWTGKALNLPLYKLWGLSPEDTPLTSFTIGIDNTDVVLKKLREASPYPLLKVKLGTGDDTGIIRSIRSETDKPIRVDVNEGWGDRKKALEAANRLDEYGVEFIEQPMPADRLDDIAWLRERSPLPLIADENVKTAADVPMIKDAFDGINIKLMKCGGLSNALKMIHTARALRLRVMIGCMIESSVGVSAAAQLSPLADYADLDGNLLVTNDPFDGVQVKEGKLLLPDSPGIGVNRRGEK